jgi:hypothetical protein
MIIREAKSTEEIKSLLMTALTEELTFTIWQRKNSVDVSYQAKGKLLELNTQGIMSFSITDPTGEITDNEFFFALEDTSILFKSIKLRMKDDVIVVALPTEAKYKERRRHERVRFKIHERKDVEILFPRRVQNDEDKYTVNSQLIDVSESGACFLVSKETLQKINTDLIFVINSLTNLKLGGQKAKIMNARKYKGPTLSQGEFYALGVMFI